MAKLTLTVFTQNTKVYVEAAAVELSCGSQLPVGKSGMVLMGDAGVEMPGSVYVGQLESIADNARKAQKLLAGDLVLRIEPKRRKK